MSEKLGARKFGDGNTEPFLGREMSHNRDYSEEIASTIDDEVRRLIESAHDQAWEILVEYRDVLDDLVLRLMDKETVPAKEILEIFEPVRKRPSRGSYTGHGKRLPSDRPPVLTPKELSLMGPKDVQELTSGNGSGGVSVRGGSDQGDGRDDGDHEGSRGTRGTRVLRSSTSPVSRRRSGRSCWPSGRTPTVMACRTLRRASPGRTPSSSPACARSPRTS